MHINAKRVIALLLTLLTALSFGALPAGAAEKPIAITILATSDVHGQLLPMDYYANEEDPTVGLSMIAAQVAAVRKTERNVLLVDAGDTVQGSALTYYNTYFAQGKDAPDDPVMKALRLMSYDMWTLGEHEFNAGIDLLKQQISYLSSKNKGSEVSVPMCTANFLNKDRSKEWTPWTGVPYVVKEFRTNTGSVKVGLIGLSTPSVPQWEEARNYRGIDFMNFVPTARHYIPILREEEGCDIVVAVCHSGVEEESSEDPANPVDPENQVRCLIEHTTGLDAVVSGHQHLTGYREDILDASGKAVPVISGGSGNGLAYMKLFYDPQTKSVTPATEENGFQLITDQEGLTEDSKLSRNMAPYNEALQAFLDQPIATAAGDFTNEDISVKPTAIMDLLHKAQLSAVPADLSICAPVANGGETRTLLPKGSVTMRQLYQLIPFDTGLCRIQMTGEQLRLWLEHASTKYQSAYSDYFGGGYYTDEIYGLQYEVLFSSPEGSRVQNMTYQGKAVTPEQTFSVVVDESRLTDGSGFLEAAGLDLSDESLIDLRTMTQHDQGLTRNILANYIRTQGRIIPTVVSSWKLIRTAGN